MINALETEEDYREALERFLQIGGAPKSEEELWEMYQLMRLLEEYEDKNCRFD